MCSFKYTYVKKFFSPHPNIFRIHKTVKKKSKTKLVLLYHWIEEAKDLFTGEC